MPHKESQTIHPTQQLLGSALREIYAGIPFKTKEQIESQTEEWIKKTRSTNNRVKLILFVWLIAIPLAIALISYFGPEWLGVIGLIYSFWKGYQTWRDLTGRSKKSSAQIKKAEKDQKMRHYFYHCELNPAGFAALRSENIQKQTQDRLRQEAATLLKSAQ